MVVGIGIVFAAPDEKGNGLPKGKTCNLNIIGAPKQKNWDADSGGQGKRIFVRRTGNTLIYVHGGSGYEIFDRDGTDGKVGESLEDPGIELPYNATTGLWQCQIYVRLLGPKDSTLDWKTWVPEEFGATTFVDDNGRPWWLFSIVNLDKEDTKFRMRNAELLPDGYQDLLWELDPTNKFRIAQVRIILVERVPAT
ncbi:MAG: hypothetical protein ACYS74_23320 [Planctomycetota bacterium]|jgi:hypothetical protein